MRAHMRTVPSAEEGIDESRPGTRPDSAPPGVPSAEVFSRKRGPTMRSTVWPLCLGLCLCLRSRLGTSLIALARLRSRSHSHPATALPCTRGCRRPPAPLPSGHVASPWRFLYKPFLDPRHGSASRGGFS